MYVCVKDSEIENAKDVNEENESSEED